MEPHELPTSHQRTFGFRERRIGVLQIVSPFDDIIVKNGKFWENAGFVTR